MKSAWTRFLSVAAVVSLLCAGTACNQKEQNEESTSSNTPVMDTTISQQAYLSELVDPATASTGIGEAPSAANPSAAAVGTSVNDAFFDDAVFVGDSVSLKLNYYVSDQRNTGNCLGKSKFLTSGSLGSAQALLAVSDESLHPTYQGQKLSIEETIANIGAKKVFIMLGMNDIAVYGIEGSVDNYEDLVNAILALSRCRNLCPVLHTHCHGVRAQCVE